MNAQRIPWKVDFTGDPGKTKQSHKDECDINILVAKWRAGGQLPMPTAEQLYGDFASSPSFLEAKIQIADAESAFAQLPAHIRDRFNNQPGDLMDFAQNPENLDEAVRLGLALSTPPFAPTEPGSSAAVERGEKATEPAIATQGEGGIQGGE